MPSKKLKKKLEAIFFGNIPSIFKSNSEVILKNALKKQGISGPKITLQDLQKLNFATLIADINAIHNSRKKKSVIDKSQEELMQEFQVAKMDIATAARYELVELTQNHSLSPIDKFIYCNFWRKFYENWGYIYQDDIIQHQPYFIDELKRFETYFYNAAMATTPPADNQPTQEVYTLSDVWKFGERALDVISNELHESGYLDNPTSFKMVFNTSNPNKHNWIGTHTSLLYLLTLLFHRHIRSVPKSVRDFSLSRFLVNGNEKTPETVRTIAAKVKPHLTKDKTELNADYRKIFIILENALQ